MAKRNDPRKGKCVRCGKLPSLNHGHECVNCGYLAKRWKMAKRKPKPDRIDRVAAKIAEANLWPEKKRDRISALVRREVRRERKAMWEEITSTPGSESGHYMKMRLRIWLDAREGRR